MNTPYKTRDEEWAKYSEAHDLRNRYGSLVLAALHDAFDAGWEGRKRAEYARAGRSDQCPAPAPQERPKPSPVRGAFHNAEINPHVAVAGSMMSADRDPYARFASGGWLPRRFGKSEFLRWDTHMRNEIIKQESVMTPMMLEVLLHAYYAAERFPRFNAPAYHEAVRRLTRDGLIEATSGREQANNPGWVIRTTEKGNVYIKALLNVPLPVQTEPEWRMPS